MTLQEIADQKYLDLLFPRIINSDEDKCKICEKPWFHGFHTDCLQKAGHIFERRIQGLVFLADNALGHMMLASEIMKKNGLEKEAEKMLSGFRKEREKLIGLIK